MSFDAAYNARLAADTALLPQPRESMLRELQPLPAQARELPALARPGESSPRVDQVITGDRPGTVEQRVTTALVRQNLPTSSSEPSNDVSLTSLGDGQRELILANAQAQASSLVTRNNNLVRDTSSDNANALANWVNHNRAEGAQEGRDIANMFRAISDALTTAREALNSRQLGNLTRNADGSITTPGGYTVVNDGGVQWRVIEPSGTQHRIWGDPHVDENNDGRDDWHFDRDASFILPDGTKIFCDTVKVGTHGAGDVTVSDMLRVMHGDMMATMDVKTAGNCTLSDGGRVFDRSNADGQVFVLGQDSAWKDGQSLGDLFDGGGDFIADVNREAIGVVSAAASAVLRGEQPPSVLPVGNELMTATQSGARLNGGITTYRELNRYIAGLEAELERMQRRHGNFDLAGAVINSNTERGVQERLDAVGGGEASSEAGRRVVATTRG